MKIKSVKLSPSDLQIPLGSRQAITAECGLSNGQVSSDIYLVWFETDGTVAQVSASGQVFAHALGTTEVTAGDDKCMAEESVKVKVVEAGGGGDDQGHGYPRILISGVNKDPDTVMDVNFQNDDPPVVQRPEDANRNIWWINSTSPFADTRPAGERADIFGGAEGRLVRRTRIGKAPTRAASATRPERVRSI